jgi:hypothetical protein
MRCFGDLESKYLRPLTTSIFSHVSLYPNSQDRVLVEWNPKDAKICFAEAFFEHIEDS